MNRSYEISPRIRLRIKRWLAPPIFPDDEMKNRRASLLELTLLVTIAFAIIILVGNLLGGRTPITIIGLDILAVAVGLILRRLAHQGQVRLASVGLIAADLIGITMFSANLGTIRTPTTAFYILIVVGAGLLFDVSGIIVTTLLSSLAVLGLILAENAHSLPSPDYTVTITQWITYTALVGLAGGLTWTAHQSTQRALQHADQEIEERKRTQGELQATREVLQQAQQFSHEIISGAGEGIAVYDREFRCLVWNRFMEDLTGVPASDVLGKKAFDVFPHLREQGIDQFLQSALGGDIVRSPDTQYTVPQTGKSGWVIGTYAPHRDVDGRNIGVVATIHEISERKQAEEALQKSEHYARSIIESSLDMIITTDNGRRIVEFNGAAQETFGYAREDVIGKHINLLYADSVEGQAVHQVTLEMGNNTQEVTNKRKNGEIFTSQVSAATISDSKGVPIGIVGVSRDITERKHSEEALRRAEEKYRKIFDHAVEGIFQSTPAGHFLEANPALARMWGYASPQELISDVTDIAQQVYADPDRRAEFRRLMEWPGEVNGFEFQVRRKDGSLLWVSENAHSVRDDHGALLYYEGTAEDITGRKQAEAALRDSEERYRELVENANDIVYTLDLVGNFTSVNPAVERITGYTCEQALTLNLAQVVSSDDFALARQMLQSKQADGRSTTYPLEIYAKDGHKVSLELSTRLVYREGKVVGSQGIARDITERKRAEEALRESEERFSGAFEHAAIGMALVSPDGRWLRVNRSVCELTGYSQSELLSKTFQDITHPDDLETDLAHARQVLAGELRTYQMEKRYLHKLGHVVWGLLSVSLVRDARGEPLHFIAQIQDITGRREAQEALRQRADEFEALYDTTRDLAQLQDLPTLLQTIVDRATRLFDAPGAFLYLYDPVQHNMELRLIKGTGVPIGTRLELDEGMAGRVAQSRQPLIIDDYQAWEHRSRKYEGIPFRATLEVPMLYGGELIGAIAVYEMGSSVRKFTEADGRVLSLFAGQAASAVYNARLHDSTERNSERMALLNAIARTVGSTIELDDLLETCLRQLLQVIPADSYYIGLYNPNDDSIDLRIHFDAGERFPPAQIPVGKGLSSLVLKERKPLLIHRLSEEMAALPIKPIIDGTGRMSESWLGVPMSAGEDLIGLLAFASYQPDAFDEEDVALLSSVASQVAMAVDNAQHHAEVEDQARRDSLTQVFNHGYLLKRLHEEIEQAQVIGSTLSLIMLDIDHFKQYNDTFGHVKGDEVLRLIVQAIQAHLKKSDMVGRWGGEEFAIVLLRATADQARIVAERIRFTLAELPLTDRAGKSIPKPTVSQGIASFPVHTSSAEKLLDAADKALYVAKQRGRDQTQVASPDRPESGFVSDLH